MASKTKKEPLALTTQVDNGDVGADLKGEGIGAKKMSRSKSKSKKKTKLVNNVDINAIAKKHKVKIEPFDLGKESKGDQSSSINVPSLIKIFILSDPNLKIEGLNSDSTVFDVRIEPYILGIVRVEIHSLIELMRKIDQAHHKNGFLIQLKGEIYKVMAHLIECLGIFQKLFASLDKENKNGLLTKWSEELMKSFFLALNNFNDKFDSIDELNQFLNVKKRYISC